MPSGPKKRRAQKKKKETAAESEKTENEAPPTASSKENSPVMQIESTDGGTAVFDEPSVVLPKRTVLPEKMMASEVLNLKGKDTKESIKETLLTEVYSSDQSSNVAEPLETCQADKIDVVVAPGVIELDSQDKDGSKIMANNICDFKGKESKVLLEKAETDTVATDATEHLQDDNVGSIIASDDADAVKSLTIGPCDFDLNAVERLNAENADAAEDQRALEHKEDNPVDEKQPLVTPENRVDVENQEIAAPNEEVAPGTTEKVFKVGEVEAAVQNKEDAISEVDNEIVKDTLEAGVENQVNAALNEVDVPEKIEAVEVEEVEVAAKNQEDDILGDVNEIEKNTLEAVAEDQINSAPNEVDAPEKSEAVAVDKVESFIAAKSALDLVSQTHDAVSAELVTPEVRKQLKEMKVIVEDVKVIVEDVLDRLNSIDALLYRS